MLTKKQKDLLEFIHKRVQRDGVPPSFDEMKEALDLRSKSGIHRLITALEERGFIRRMAHRARAIEIVKLPDAMGGFVPQVIEGDKPETSAPAPALKGIPVERGDVAELPLMGRIAAGVPIEAIGDGDTSVAVPGMMLRGRGSHYALEVRGDSMIEAGINDGDLVIILETEEAKNGDIVVAQVEGYEATLKTYRKNGSSIALEPANPAFETRVFREGQVEVQGRLVGLIRSY